VGVDLYGEGLGGAGVEALGYGLDLILTNLDVGELIGALGVGLDRDGGLSLQVDERDSGVGDEGSRGISDVTEYSRSFKLRKEGYRRGEHKRGSC
jgi:hypothetical protein